MVRTETRVVKRGNRLGFWFFRTAARFSGLRGAYGLLYPVCLYYLLFDRAAVAGGMAYVRRRFPDAGGLRRLGSVYRLFIEQGKSLVDRFAMVSGARDLFAIDIEGYDAVKKALQKSGKGIILLTAHVGNWQVAMTALERFGRTVHLLMRPEDNAAVREALGIDQERGTVRILSSEGDLGGVLEAVKAVSSGDIVSIMGDRAYGYRTVTARLFGEPVRFPFGAFSIASAAGCPVVVLLSAKTAPRRYLVDVSQVIEPPAGAGRGAKLAALRECVEQFAGGLERYARRHPYQWFVFSDLWERAEGLPPEGGSAREERSDREGESR